MNLTLLPSLARTAPDREYVPANLEELYEKYYVYLRNLVRKHGIDTRNVDDVVQKIFEKIITTGMLEDFDPDYGMDARKVFFRTFLSSFTLTYLRHYRHVQNVEKRREPQYIDSEVEFEGKTETWGAVYGPSYEETYDELRLAEFLATARAKIGAIKPKRADSHNLVDLFDAVAEQILSGHADIDVRALAEKFGRSGATIYNRLGELRLAMEEVGLHVRAA